MSYASYGNGSLHQLLNILVSGKTLTFEQTVEAFELIMTGQAGEAQIGALLALMQARGPTIDEIRGAAHVMRSKATCVTVPEGYSVIDTCGTGGDHAGTFNISTAAAIVAAGVLRPHRIAVAKHGNRSVTSQSGSSQVLEALGVRLDVTGETMGKCLIDAGLCFCFAPAHHPAMKFAAPVRKQLGIRTIFNLLGPLTNPAGARRQLMGVFSPALTEPIAEVLLSLGAEHAMVVHGQTPAGGLDELSVFGPTRISEARDGKVTTQVLDPADLGLAGGSIREITVDGPEASARIVRRVLEGEAGVAREIVTLNAAAALTVAGVAEDLRDGLYLARHSIDDGAAQDVLASLVSLTTV